MIIQDLRLLLSGSAFVSTGDSGKLHLWKQDAYGEFAEFAEAEPT